MKKRSILILVILLAIGFAGVSTTLVLSGIVGISSNQDDFNIIFTNALLNNVERKDFIDPETKKTITFETNKLTKVNEEAVLDYEVTNTSKLYDGDVKIVCNLIDKDDNIIEDYEYIDISYEPKSMTVEAGKKETGSITAKLKKAATEDGSVKLKCKLDAEAKERDDIPTTTKTTTTEVEESDDDPEPSDEVCFGTECFYVIENDGTTAQLLAKYNIEVGSICTNYPSITPIENPSGIQNKEMVGKMTTKPYKGVIAFSSTNYWKIDNPTIYPAYVYNNKSYLYEHVENYVNYLNDNYHINATGKLISKEQLVALGCDTKNKICTSAPSWVYSTSYWTGTASDYNNLWIVLSYDKFYEFNWDNYYELGVRPVITVSSNLI